MTNYNCKEKEKLEVTVEDIRCFQCKKKFLTQNLFEWHGCFLKTRGTCAKCGQFFVKKKLLLKHYVLCEGLFVTPEAARDPIKAEKNSSRGSVVKVSGVRKKTVPQRRMTTIKAEKEVSLATDVTEHQHQQDEDDDEYANYEDDITYDNFGSDDDDDESGPSMTNLEPVVELQEQQQPQLLPQVPAPRIIEIKAEMSADPQIIRNIKREHSSRQPVVAAHKAPPPPALRIKAERGANEQPVVQVLNPLAIGSSAKTPSTITARKKVFKLPQELAVKIKKEKMSGEYGDGVRDEAEPDSEEEEQMARISPPVAAIKEEKMDSSVVQQKKAPVVVQSGTKQLINPMALAMMREKSSASGATNGSESSKSLVIAAVTSMSLNGRESEEEDHGPEM
jgi:hypothetical protein